MATHIVKHTYSCSNTSLILMQCKLCKDVQSHYVYILAHLSSCISQQESVNFGGQRPVQVYMFISDANPQISRPLMRRLCWRPCCLRCGTIQSTNPRTLTPALQWSRRNSQRFAMHTCSTCHIDMLWYMHIQARLLWRVDLYQFELAFNIL